MLQLNGPIGKYFQMKSTIFHLIQIIQASRQLETPSSNLEIVITDSYRQYNPCEIN